MREHYANKIYQKITHQTILVVLVFDSENNSRYLTFFCF